MAEPVPIELVLAARKEMPREARRIVDAARERGIDLRLMGGLGVREHCAQLAFCERDYADLDMVGRRRQFRAIAELFADLGYEENMRARLSTRGRQLQFVRACEHVDPGLGVSVHPDDHVDVFLDTFKMDHELDLGDRLESGEYTLPVTDLLLTKLQIHKTNEKDLRDILTLLKDLDVRDVDGDQAAAVTDSSRTADVTGVHRKADVIDVRRIAEECAEDWGMYYDVVQNLRRAEAALEAHAMTAEERARLRAAVGRLNRAIEQAPKSRAWRKRAKVGTRKPWYNEIEDQDDE
jgi:hypothetical protein